METNITVVDSIMGSGKSSAMIQYMNEETDKKFIYITPYLDEVQRVKDECTCRLFKEPYRNSNTKMDNLLGLLEDGYNIATTHALFKNLDDRCMEYIRDNNYVLIMDEVIEVVEEVDIDKNDVDMLLDTRKIEINKDGQIMWIDKEYNGKFNEYKQALRNGDCYMYSETIILWTFPIRILSLFKETYVLTHLFEGSMQCNYYKMNNIEYKYKSVKKVNDRYELCDFYIPKIGNELRDKVHVYEGRLNDIGYSKNKKTNPLSKSWYQKKGSTNERCRIVKIIYIIILPMFVKVNLMKICGLLLKIINLNAKVMVIAKDLYH